MDPQWKEYKDNLTRESQAAPEPEHPQWPDPIPYADFESLVIEKPRPLVQNILDIASRMIFGGGSKTYKTWAMSDLALSLVVGAEWWGFDAFQATALYVNFELKPYYMRERMRAIRLAKKIGCGPLYILNLRGYDVSLCAFKEMLLREIDAHKILVVFVDPFYKLLGAGDERVSGEINIIMGAFDEINRLTGATVVFAAHFTKGNQSGKESIDRISGGGSINRDPDNLVTMTKHETDHAFTVDFTLRDFAPIQPFVVRWDYPLLVRTDLDPEKIKRPTTRSRPGFEPEELYNLIKRNDDEFSTEELISKAEETLEWSRRTILNKLDTLKRAKRVWVSVASNKWNVHPV